MVWVQHTLISGLPEIDLTDLELNTEYSGWKRSDPQIEWFWDVMRGLTHEEKVRIPILRALMCGIVLHLAGHIHGPDLGHCSIRALSWALPSSPGHALLLVKRP